ncbi:hypothetical protein GCM10027046_10530 [Uliginosibacterium flavum]
MPHCGMGSEEARSVWLLRQAGWRVKTGEAVRRVLLSTQSSALFLNQIRIDHGLEYGLQFAFTLAQLEPP